MPYFSLADAAYEVVRASARPMRAGEILQIARANGLIQGSTESSLRTILYGETRLRNTRFVQVDGGFALSEWIHHADGSLRQLVADGEIVRSIRPWLVDVRDALQGKAPLPPADVLCVWIEVCYRLDLPAEGTALAARLTGDAEPWLLKRARRFARLLSAKSPEQPEQQDTGPGLTGNGPPAHGAGDAETAE